MADETLAFDLLVRDRNASRTLKGVGDAATKTGRDFDKAAGGAGHLSAQIDETTLRLRELGEEFDKTGDKSLLKDIGRERRTLGGLTKLRKEMAGLAEDTAKVASAGGGLFSGVSGAFGPQGRTAIIGGLVAAGLTAAPMIGAAITGAVVGAVGSGVIAAGIAGAARSPQVRAAWELLADEGKSVFADFSVPFVEPTVDAINILRGSLASVRGDLDAIADDASRFVGPLAGGIGGFVEEMVPGIRSLVHEAEPVFDMFGNELPRLGRSVGDFFEHLGAGAEGGADALRALLRVVEGTLAVLGPQLEIWAEEIELVADASQKLGVVAGPMALLFAENEKKAKGTGKAFENLAEAADDVKFSVKGMSDAYSEWLGLSLDAEGLADRFKLSLFELDDAVRENGFALDDNTEGGLKNQQEIRDRIELLNRIREAEIKKAGGTEEAVTRANAAYDAEIKKLIEVGVKAGLSRSELEKLAGSYNINVFMTGLERIRQQLRALGSAASLVPGLGGASIGFHLASGILGAALAQRYGGIVEAAQGAIVNSPTVLFGERAAGQEVFIPQNVSRQRGLALSAVAAGMHGASVVPNERMSAGGAQDINIVITGDGLLTGLRREIRIRGGNVQTVLGR